MKHHKVEEQDYSSWEVLLGASPVIHRVPFVGGSTFGGGANGFVVKETTFEVSFAAAPPPETLILDVTLICKCIITARVKLQDHGISQDPV